MKDEIIQIDGKFYKQCEVVMLPTEDKITFNHINTEIESCGSLEYNLKELKKGNVVRNPFEVPITILENGQMINSLERCDFPSKNDNFYHLYILSSEEIKIDSKSIGNERKIIATTDKSLFLERIGDTGEIYGYKGKPIDVKDLLPRPSDDFIKKFVEKQGKIDKVLVEYENINTTKQEDYKYNDKTGGNLNYVWKPKIAPDNTITIRPIQEEKTSWSREEVIKLCMDAMLYSYMDLPENLTPIQGMNKWIEENL